MPVEVVGSGKIRGLHSKWNMKMLVDMRLKRTPGLE
jgi:hypothetical protein